jgi:hypothetical protein
VVKDDVHRPDWTTPERLAYTKRLARILAYLLPEELHGGISTSPLSYKPWFGGNEQQLKEVYQQGTQQLAELVAFLMHLQKETGRLIHLDIEPEPDGLLENTAEFIEYYDNWLLPHATDYLQRTLGLSARNATEIIRTHVQLCYDVCHFALAYEEPQNVFDQLASRGIKIGRAQISAALKADLPPGEAERKALADQFKAFSESTYLHQVVVRNNDGSLTQYPDLPPALEHFQDQEAAEWRSHFHVPVFLERYNQLQSTQAEILKVLQILEKQPYTTYLEIETYTWEVLPPEIKLDLGASIQRELAWVRSNFEVQN